MVTPTHVVTSDWFAMRIRTLREASGLTPDQLAKAIGRSPQSVRHFEARNRPINTAYVEDSLGGLGHGHLIEPYTRIVDRSKQAPLWWLDAIPKLTKSQKPPALEQLELLVNFEASAASLRIYAPHCVPDLVQTPAYTAALREFGEPPLGPLQASLLPGRQGVLAQNEPDVHLLLDDAVLRRAVGGPAVLREQLAHLGSLAERHHVTVQVLPSAVAAQAAAEGNFTLLDLAEELEHDPGAVFVRTAADWVHFREPAKVGAYRARWAALLRDALTPADSLATIGHAARELPAI
ncbi:helix-turn-helix domain-containing protein [Prauserella muralis]|uniref:helix-turn-helix domain-containing protein n=1 Tax=Prauserella muralis TaxID=588067 RepID=UPI0011AD7134|nr:helix-turn-helix transcriptional regulator [Prauserella muralis]TWE29408.1 helix-turn-helix protein [Prauserella muralis]